MKKLYEHAIEVMASAIVVMTIAISFIFCGFIFLFSFAHILVAINSSDVNVYINGDLKYSGTSFCVGVNSAGNNTSVSINRRWSGCLFQKERYVSNDVVLTPVAKDVDER
jgi:hypothetical protein